MSRLEYYKKKSIPVKWIITGLILAIFMIVSSILLLLYPFASKEKVIFFENPFPILFKDKEVGNALVQDGKVFLPISFLQEYLDESILFDEKSQSVIITTQNKVIQMPTESLTYYVNEKAVHLHLPAVQNTNGELFVAVEPLLNYYPIQYKRLEDSNAIWIQENGDTLVHGMIKNIKVHEEKLRLRTDASLQSPYVSSVVLGEKIYIEGQKDEYVYIRKEDGIAGYVHSDFIQKENEEVVTLKKEEYQANIQKINGPIQLTWEAVYTKNPDPKKLPDMPGLNVVSPTWFELENGEGSIKNLGSLEFVKWAHSRKLQVWGLFSNAFDPELTHIAFKDYETRQKMIRQLLHYSQMYHLNGINLDIENVNVEDGPLVTQFVREATPLFHEAGLTVSMDITFISTSGNWSAFYEREKLSKIVDYLIVMAYDEHWGSSTTAGSVASFPWVEENLLKLLEIVPNDRLILGVPFYTRLWKEQQLANGDIEVSSKALSMSKVKEWLTKNKLTPTYDNITGQNYAELSIPSEKVTYKIWIEDEHSLKKRADLASKYKLAGVASWSRFFADETAWAALQFNKNYTDADNN
jgi:spore germination protein YaaH